MESIREWMQFTDVTLVTASAGGGGAAAGGGCERLRAHRAILASHSSFLRQLLIDHAAEAGVGQEEEPVLVLKDLPAAHLRLMMQFFYTGEVSLSTQEDVQPLRESCLVLGVSSFISRFVARRSV